jgi:hypothetical protein
MARELLEPLRVLTPARLFHLGIPSLIAVARENVMRAMSGQFCTEASPLKLVHYFPIVHPVTITMTAGATTTLWR